MGYKVGRRSISRNVAHLNILASTELQECSENMVNVENHQFLKEMKIVSVFYNSSLF